MWAEKNKRNAKLFFQILPVIWVCSLVIFWLVFNIMSPTRKRWLRPLSQSRSQITTFVRRARIDFHLLTSECRQRNIHAINPALCPDAKPRNIYHRFWLPQPQPSPLCLSLPNTGIVTQKLFTYCPIKEYIYGVPVEQLLFNRLSNIGRKTLTDGCIFYSVLFLFILNYSLFFIDRCTAVLSNTFMTQIGFWKCWVLAQDTFSSFWQLLKMANLLCWCASHSLFSFDEKRLQMSSTRTNPSRESCVQCYVQSQSFWDKTKIFAGYDYQVLSVNVHCVCFASDVFRCHSFINQSIISWTVSSLLTIGHKTQNYTPFSLTLVSPHLFPQSLYCMVQVYF